MLGYYKRHIVQLSMQLQELRSHPDDLQLLVALQLEILARIIHMESKISRSREQLGALKRQLMARRLPKDAAANLKRDIAVKARKVKQSQWLLFVWRCFGDGIAFAYLDKWAMKPLLYNIDNPQVKQGAGHITGKEGLKWEIELLQRLANVGVPALLTDLTNSIRHGDICLLAGDDPYLIEVKSSENTNRRVERQTEDIRSIHSYLVTDQALNVRGVPHVKRIEHCVPEKNYIDMLDAAIGTALQEGLFVADLEAGTRLIVLGNVRRPDHSKILAKVFAGMEQPNIYMLNVAKNEQAWGCYYPFTLSLKTPDHLYAFLHGDVFVIVAFDLPRIQSLAAGLGLTFSVLDEPIWVYQFEHSVTGSTSQISSHFATRMAFELLSWEWVLGMAKLRLAQI
jgi:hypothetical protein